MAEGQNPEIFHKEIAELEAKLAAKKQELLATGVETPEKHVFAEVVREHAFASEAPGTAVPVSTTPAPTHVHRAPSDRDEAAIAPIIAHAFVKGIASAVSQARKLGDPYLIDLLHDRLVDQYYEKLVAARKIKT